MATSSAFSASSASSASMKTHRLANGNFYETIHWCWEFFHEILHHISNYSFQLLPIN